MATTDLTQEQIDNANKLLDKIMDDLKLKNDAALSRALEVAPPVISKIRHGRLAIGSTIMIAIHEVAEISIREIKKILKQSALASHKPA